MCPPLSTPPEWRGSGARLSKISSWIPTPGATLYAVCVSRGASQSELRAALCQRDKQAAFGHERQSHPRSGPCKSLISAWQVVSPPPCYSKTILFHRESASDKSRSEEHTSELQSP